MSHRGVYTSSVQAICRYFEHHLAQAQDAGFVIADSRDKEKNAIVAHSIFTQKFQLAGDRYPASWRCRPMVTARTTSGSSLPI